MNQNQDPTFESIMQKLQYELKNADPKDIKISVGDENIIEMNPAPYKPDLGVRVDDTIIFIGLETKVVETEDIKRFNSFIAEYDLKKNNDDLKLVLSIISTAEKSKTVEYKINELNTFTFQITSVDDIGENEAVKALIENKTIQI